MKISVMGLKNWNFVTTILGVSCLCVSLRSVADEADNFLTAISSSPTSPSQSEDASDEARSPKKKKKKSKTKERQKSETQKDVSRKLPAEPMEVHLRAAPEPSPSADVAKAVEAPTEATTEDGLFGNWGGLKSASHNAGYDLALVYKADLTRNVLGGIQKDGFFLGNLDVELSVDAEKAWSLRGWSFVVSGLGNHGSHPSQSVGDIQTVSNIDAPSTFKLYQAWVQKNFLEGGFSLLAGLYDLNSEFYANDSAGLFINSSFGIGGEMAYSGANGPSIFPSTSLGIRMKSVVSSSAYLQTAVLDGVPGNPDHPYGTHISLSKEDGALVVTEVAFLRGGESVWKGLAGKYAAGVWSYTRAGDHNVLQDADGSPVKGVEHGYYVLAEQHVSEPIALFVRYGWANPEFHPVKSCVTAGINITGLISDRASDSLGLGLARAQLRLPKCFFGTAKGGNNL